MKREGPAAAQAPMGQPPAAIFLLRCRGGSGDLLYRCSDNFGAARRECLAASLERNPRPQASLGCLGQMLASIQGCLAPRSLGIVIGDCAEAVSPLLPRHMTRQVARRLRLLGRGHGYAASRLCWPGLVANYSIACLIASSGTVPSSSARLVSRINCRILSGTFGLPQRGIRTLTFQLIVEMA